MVAGLIVTKYYDPDNTRLKCEENSFTACPYCGYEVSCVGAINVCHNCDLTVEGQTIIRYWGVNEEHWMEKRQIRHGQIRLNQGERT